MNENHILLIVGAYFLVLIVISYFTGRKADNEDFFLAGRESPWYVVAFGMIGASLSGVTFISIPGWVEEQAFSYMVMVFGYLFGYLFIAQVLMPMYYRLQLTSIYTYLERRFGPVSYKTGAAFFLISRSIGAAFRLYLVALVMQTFVMAPLGLPFPLTVAATILLIWLYTFRGGIATIIWTDTLQTLAMLVAVVLTIYFIGQKMDLGLEQMYDLVVQSDRSQIFFWEDFAGDKRHAVKRFIAGIFIAIVMTGLDQDMMQKNLSCRSLPEAKKNMLTFSVVLIFVNLLFLAMGTLLFAYASTVGIAVPEDTDLLYPTIALQHLPFGAGVVFVLGLVAAAYSSADSALTSLTTSFCVDVLELDKGREGVANDKKIRTWVHVGFSILLFTIILVFWNINNDAVVSQIFTVAGYTYGPLLGLYFFGFFTRQTVNDNWVWLVALLAPALSFLIQMLLSEYEIYELGFELLLLNGLLMFLGLLLISHYDHDMSEQGFHGL